MDLLITLAHRTMFVVGGVLCVWLAYRLLHIGLAGTQSMIDDLKWTVADARRAVEEARKEVERLAQAELSAVTKELESAAKKGLVTVGKDDLAKASQTKVDTVARLDEMVKTTQAAMTAAGSLGVRAGGTYGVVWALLVLALLLFVEGALLIGKSGCWP